jgi:hypothetical protein
MKDWDKSDTYSLIPVVSPALRTRKLLHITPRFATQKPLYSDGISGVRTQTEKKEALIEIQQLMQTLVRILEITPSSRIPTYKTTQPVEPLIFEPGTDWAYGLSTDWAGQIVLTSSLNLFPHSNTNTKKVERLTHQSLESYCQQQIFTPLSMTHSTFSPSLHPHINSSLIPLHTRTTPTSPLTTTTSIYP